MQGHIDIVQLLLDAGADMEATNDIGETPVKSGVLGQHVDVLRLLHQRGAAFSPADKIKCTLLSDAVLFNAHDCIQFLLELRLRADLKYFHGKTILHILAENSDRQTMEIFMGTPTTGFSRIDAEDVDSNGYTACEYLALREDEDAVKETFEALLCAINAARVLELESHATD
ncbi:ankyrin [Acephala macrosclerotiorum]|nr:ankyrin [Acephala macrosclerotiorum]